MIYIFDKNFKKIEVLKHYTFSQFEIKFRDIGTFTINVRLNEENIYLMNTDETFYVLFEDDNVLGKIEKIKKESDSEYVRLITLSGRLAPLIFTKRVMYGKVIYEGNTVDYIEQIIYENFKQYESASSLDKTRYVNINTKLFDEEYLRTISSEYDREVFGGNVWDEMKSALEKDKLGFIFEPVVEESHEINGIETNISKWDLTLTAGVDRTVGNSKNNEPVILSQSLSNINRTEYEYSNENYVGVLYIAGEEEEEEEDREWYIVNRNNYDLFKEQETEITKNGIGTVMNVDERIGKLEYLYYQTKPWGSIEINFLKDVFKRFVGRIIEITTVVPSLDVYPYCITDAITPTEVIENGKNGVIGLQTYEVFIPDNAQRLIINYDNSSGLGFGGSGGKIIVGESADSGWERSELYVDARDIKHCFENEQGMEICYFPATYRKKINERAKEVFVEYDNKEIYSSTLTEKNIKDKYNKEYFLGDYVTVIDEELNISLDVQIISYSKSEENSRVYEDIVFEYGKTEIGYLKRLNEVEYKTKQNVANISYLDSKVKKIDKKINNGYIQSAIHIYKDTDETEYSTEYTAFCPFNNNVSVYGEKYGNLSLTSKFVTYGDRTEDEVYGVLVGEGIKTIRAFSNVYVYKDEGSSTAVQSYIRRIRNNDDGTVSNDIFSLSVTSLEIGRQTLTTEALVDVKEGDFIFVSCYKGVMTQNVDIKSSYRGTSLIVESIR